MSAGFSWKWRAIIPFLAKEQTPTNQILPRSHYMDWRAYQRRKPMWQKPIHKPLTSGPREQPSGRKGRSTGPAGWSADQPMGPTSLSLWRGTPSLDGEVGSGRLQLKSRPRRGWLPSINMRGGAPFQGVKRKREKATLLRCSLSPLVEVIGLEEFGFES